MRVEIGADVWVSRALGRVARERVAKHVGCSASRLTTEARRMRADGPRWTVGPEGDVGEPRGVVVGIKSRGFTQGRLA